MITSLHLSLQNSVTISPRKIYSTMYIATNKTNSEIVGQAIPSVSPK